MRLVWVVFDKDMESYKYALYDNQRLSFLLLLNKVLESYKDAFYDNQSVRKLNLVTMLWVIQKWFLMMLIVWLDMISMSKR